MEKRDTLKLARPVGRILRFALGFLLIAASLPYLLSAEPAFLLPILLVVLLLAAFYSLVHFLVNQYIPHINPWLGAVLANSPAIAIYIFGGGGGPIFGAGEGQLATLIFVGLSLVIASLRADAGCEVMSIPGLLFGRRTRLACLLFSPIDWMEEKLFARKRYPGSS
ncbi:MAG TPA: hypothetical protein VGA03_02240 [Anaerolineales bacterium]